MASLLTIHEVAALTRLHHMTIRRYIQEGRLEAVKVGRQIRVSQEAVEQLLEPIGPETSSTETDHPTGRVLQDNDPIFEIVGLSCAPVDDLSENKYHYLADGLPEVV